MNIEILSKNLDLIKFLEDKSEYKIIPVKELFFYENNYYVISDEEISFTRLLSKLENKYRYKISYILSNCYETTEITNIISVGKSNGINIIPPNTSEDQVCQNILRNINPNFSVNFNNKKIVTFIGADSKVGVTMVSQSIAEIISVNTDLKVCFMLLNECKGGNYFQNPQNKSIDNIRSKLSSKLINNEDILNVSIRINKKLYIIPGPADILNMRYYFPEDLELLIDKASKMFDILIIDSGSKIDSALTTAALNSTCHKILVTTQQNNAINNYEKISSQIFDLMGLNYKEFMIVINRYRNLTYLFSVSELTNMFQMIPLGFLPDVGMIDWQAEYHRKSLLSYKNDMYTSQIIKMGQILSNKMGIEFNYKYKAVNPLKKLKNKILKEVI
jgi:MinD-like ATPase involved in chromosome partitioning or flagellar assembly